MFCIIAALHLFCRNALENINRLSRVLQSEVSVGNDAEKHAVGWTVLNRMNRKQTDLVRDVDGAYSRAQAPVARMRELARKLLNNEIVDPTAGATHYYSPRTMPKEGDDTDGYDVGGGLEQIAGLPKRNYKPSWAGSYSFSSVANVRASYYRFYIAPGQGPVK